MIRFAAVAFSLSALLTLSGPVLAEIVPRTAHTYVLAPGTMLGTFKLLDGDEVAFYELREFSVTDGRLGPDTAETYIVMRDGDAYREEKLTYRRVD